MVEKVLIMVEDSDTDEFVDIYFDESLIKGWYLTDDNHKEGSVCIITGDSSMILKQSDTLKSFLLNKKW